MLILSRRPDESIFLGDDVIIKIVSVKGQQVKLGIDAPPEVKVHREEVYERIKSSGSERRPDKPGPT